MTRRIPIAVLSAVSLLVLAGPAASQACSFDDMEAGTAGWTVGVPGDTATTGIWELIDPVATAAQPEDDHTPGPGVNAWITGQQPPGGTLGTNDVDGGPTTLVSPVLDLTSASS